ncbi:hypothetical protein [Microbacterium sp. ZW T5_56]|uniref:hypothetical protein n=1 Tax=Microbacterium sp. ZW T5_56 TaxID=3378081 RepID=UPI00385264E9
MSWVDEVRTVRTDETQVTEAQLATARRALQREIDRTASDGRSRSRQPRSRRLGLSLGLGGVGVAGALAVVGIVAGSVFAPVPSPDAAAAEVFLQAQESVLDGIGAADVTLEPGQYLRVEQVTEQLTTDGSQSDVAAEKAGFLLRQVSVLYVPADRSEDWIVEADAAEVVALYGDDAEAFTANVLSEGLSQDVLTAYPEGVRDGQPIDKYRDDYDTMPRDPDELLAWFGTRAPESYVGFELTNALFQNLPPADIRAAMLGALARVPGYTLVSRDGNIAVVQEAPLSDGPEARNTLLTIDTSTGQILSFTDVQRHPGNVVPADIPEQVITFTTSIVDEAPTPQ